MDARRPSIVVIAPGRGLSEHTIDSPFRLGRAPDADLRFELAWLSAHHVSLESADGEVWRVVAGGPDVFVNGVPVPESAALRPGDRIDLGTITVVFDGSADRAFELDDSTANERAAVIDLADVVDQRMIDLGRISSVLAGSFDAAEVARTACEAITKHIGARSCCIVELGDDGTSQSRIIGARGEPIDRISRILVQRAIANASVLTVDDASASTDLRVSETIRDNDVGPVVMAPLGAPAQGVLYADRRAGEQSFARDDVAYVTVIAHLVGPVLIAARRSEGVVKRSERLRDVQQELMTELLRRGGFGRLIGTSAPMAQLASQIERVGPSDATVLITGETGTGKELVAREVHQQSRRSGELFLAINCGALPETLVESELFGHVRGAFSGAVQDRRGILDIADGGTVFLDEIGELPLSAQVKLLRVLDNREILPLGSGRPKRVDVRVLAATHRDLPKDVEEGGFRQDLYFRLKVFPLHAPPLRDRRSDIPALVDHFIETNDDARRKSLGTPDSSFVSALMSYDFPGNVRELMHLVQRAIILAAPGEPLSAEHLPEEIDVGPTAAQPTGTLRDVVIDFERRTIIEALEANRWNRTRTAEQLGLSLRGFMGKLKRYDIKPRD